MQDGVVLHALETEAHGLPVPNRTYAVDGKQYAVYVGKRVSLAHQSQVHGPARVDDDVFVGMQALVFKSWIGRGTVVEPGARVIGVIVPPGRYVPAGTVLTDQKLADKLPEITEEYPFRGLNEAVVHVNTSFAESYGRAARPKPEPGAGAAGRGAPAAPRRRQAAITTIESWRRRAERSRSSASIGGRGPSGCRVSTSTTPRTTAAPSAPRPARSR